MPNLGVQGAVTDHVTPSSMAILVFTTEAAPMKARAESEESAVDSVFCCEDIPNWRKCVVGESRNLCQLNGFHPIHFSRLCAIERKGFQLRLQVRPTYHLENQQNFKPVLMSVLQVLLQLIARPPKKKLSWRVAEIILSLTLYSEALVQSRK